MSENQKQNPFVKIPLYTEDSLTADNLIERRLLPSISDHARDVTDLHASWRIPWEILWKVSIFYNPPKIFFRAVNYLNSRWEIHGNYPGGGRISLKTKLIYFMLIMRPDKLHGIPIVRGLRISDIPSKLSMWRDLRGVDWHLKSAWSWNKVNKETFLASKSIPDKPS